MKYLLLCLAGLLFSLYLPGQPAMLHGKVLDYESHAAVGFSHVSILNTNVGALSDGRGEFVLSVPASASFVDVIVSALGYKTDTIHVRIASDVLVYLMPVNEVLEEIVITGSAKETLVRYNPVAVSVVSAADIEKTIDSNVIDVLVKNVPGLNAVKTGPNISKPYIRGLGYNRVLTLYDGIRQEGQQWGDEHGIEVDAYNIEKAEVVKGPASLLYGSDALAGVVSMVSYRPKEKDGVVRGRVLSEYQSNNGLVGNSLRIVCAGEHWYWLATASNRKATNYRNRVDGRVYNTGFDERNASLSLGHESTAGRSQVSATLYDNLQGIPDGSRDSLTRRFTKQVLEGAEDDVKNRPIVSDAELNSYTLSPLHQHIQHYRIYSNHHYKLGRGDADFLLALQQNVRREFNHPTDAEQPGMFVRLNTVNYGFRFNAPPIREIEITIGTNGMYQSNKNKNATDFPIPDYQLMDGGIYQAATWSHTRWTLTGGVRYDLRAINSADFYIGRNPDNGFNYHASQQDTSATLQFPQLKQRFGGLSFSGGATYQLSDRLSIKANMARGYRAPNIAEIASNGLDPGAHILYIGNRGFHPEFSFQQDIGLVIFTPNLSGSLSAFHNVVRNYIYLSQLVDSNGNAVELSHGNKTFQYQQGSARLYGAEAAVTFSPGSLSHLSIENNVSVVLGNNTGKDFRGKGVNGSYLPFIPPAKMVMTVRYKVPVKSKIVSQVTPQADMEYSARQNRFFARYNTETTTPSYMLIHAGVTVEAKGWKRTKIQLHLQANNLLNTIYQSNLSRLKYFEYYTVSASGYRGMYGMGRNLAARLTITF